MQRHREGDPQPLVGKSPDGRRKSHRRDGDTALGYAEPLRRRRGDLAQHRQHAVVVGQGLPHAHEDDVGQAARPTRQLAVTQGRRGIADLFQNLGGRQIACQSALAGGAERTGHTAPRLRGDAQRVAVRITHEHRFDGAAVMQAPQGFSGISRITGNLAQWLEQPGKQRLGHPAAGTGRQVRHRGRVTHQPSVILVGDLLGTKCGKPQFGDHVTALLKAHIGQMTGRHGTTRCVEDQRQGLVIGRHNRFSIPGFR
ncbi:Uncharacterised protein [Mycobacteroides abscessus subsp. abscessus]|nr:Uncharacterised protein [Mycobacteroides abscessus subsp. abscessus]